MQTFLPYKDFRESAEVLDKKRLFKQAVECKQLICSLRLPNIPQEWVATKSYENQSNISHPACKMWRDHGELLKHYYNIMLDESWRVRGINTSMEFIDNEFSMQSFTKTKDEGLVETLVIRKKPEESDFPWWMTEEFHQSHRGRLYDKDPDYYFSFEIDYDLQPQYLWPDLETKEFYTI